MVSDKALSSQLSYVEIFHNLLAAASDAAKMRAGKLGEAAASAADVPLTEQSAAVLNTLRRHLHGAEDMTHMRGFDKIFQSPAEGKGHLGSLDGLLQSASHSQSILGVARHEMSVWGNAWGKSLEALVQEIGASTPSGWTLKKADLLDESNGAIVSALLGNSGFTRLSKAVTQLCQLFTILQSVKRSSGQNLVSATVWETCKAAVASGSETVSVTYALHQLLKVIPKLPVAQKKAAIGKLRSDMRQRGVDMGPSLAAECARLEAS